MRTAFLIVRRAAFMGVTAYILLLGGNLAAQSGGVEAEIEAAPSAVAKISPLIPALRGSYD